MTRITIRVGDFPEYLRKHPGAIPILVFILTLVVVAVIYPYNRVLADELITNAFYFLVVGVILQAIACARSKKPSNTNKESLL